MANSPKTHKDVEFMVEDGSFSKYMKNLAEATHLAIARAASHGRPVQINVLVSSRAGARWYGGDYGVEEYEADPEASVHDQIIARAESRGRIA